MSDQDFSSALVPTWPVSQATVRFLRNAARKVPLRLEFMLKKNE